MRLLRSSGTLEQLQVLEFPERLKRPGRVQAKSTTQEAGGASLTALELDEPGAALGTDEYFGSLLLVRWCDFARGRRR